MAVNEVDQPVSQVAGKIRTVIGAAVFAEAAGNEDAGELLGGHLDIGISLVVAEQDVEPRLVLFDERVFKCEGFLLVVDDDVIDVAGFADQGAGFGVGQTFFGEVIAHTGAEKFGFADVYDLGVGILVEIHAG